MRLSLFTIVVRDYDEAIDFYVNRLGFELLEDTDLGKGKRWVRVAPRAAFSSAQPRGVGLAVRTSSAKPGDRAAILLAKAVNPAQLDAIGNQTGGRVMMFIETDDFERDYHAMRAKGVKFVREPVDEAYGRVAVLQDLHGNLFDLIQPANGPLNGDEPARS